MKTKALILLTSILSLSIIQSLAQCGIEAGNDSTIICGESIELTTETNWFAMNSGTTKNLKSAYFTNPNTGYLVGDSGIILKTINGAISFTTQTSGTYDNLFTVYFTGVDTGYILGNNGLILKTINGGTTWTSQTSGTTLGLHAIFFTSAQTGYVGGDDGLILKTTNGGSSWTQLSTYVNTMFRSFYFTNTDTGYAVGYSGVAGIIKTTNGGATWISQYTQNNINFQSVWFTSKDTGFVSGTAGNGFIMKTTNGGNNWIVQYNENMVVRSMNFTSKTTGYVLAFMMGSSVVTPVILKTSNGGLSWVSRQLPSVNYLNSIFFSNLLTAYICGNNGALLKSAAMNSYSWTPASGLSATNIANPIASPTETTTYTVIATSDSCVVSDSITLYVNPLVAYAGSDKITNCIDSVPLNVVTNGIGSKVLTYQWTPTTGLNNYAIKDPYANVLGNTTYLISVTAQNGCHAVDTVTVSLNINVDAGLDQTVLCSKSVQLNIKSKWLTLNSNSTSTFKTVYFLNADTGYTAGFKSVFKTFNGGITWTEKPISTSISLINALYFTNTNTGYAVGSSNLQMNGAISKTTDGGDTWTIQTFIGSYVINAICFPSANIGYAVGSPGKIYKTINGGGSWVPQTSGTTVSLNAVYFLNTNIGFAFGANGIILKTTNGGSTWIGQSSITSQEFTSICFVSADTGYIATANGGILRTTNSGNNWTFQTNNINTNSYATHNLNAIDFIDVNTGYAVTHYSNIGGPQTNTLGAIFKTTNGGQNWVRQLADSNSYLYGLYFPNAGTGFAVGNNGSILKLPLPPASFSWWPATGLSNPNIANPIASPTLNTSYIITGSTNGCSVRDSITVFVKPLVINAGEDITAVCGDSAQLKINNVFLDINASQLGSSWDIKDSTNKIWFSSIANSTTTGNFYLPEGKYIFTCKPKIMPPPLKIRILPFAEDSISEIIFWTNDTQITRTFHVITSGKYTYTWYPTQSIIGPGSGNKEYFINVSSPEGCTATDSVMVFAMPLRAQAGDDKTIVCGASILLDSVGSNYTGGGKLSYRWLPASGLNFDTVQNPVSKIISTKTYTLNVSTPNGCEAVDSIVITVNPLTIEGTDRNVMCGDTVHIITHTNYTGADSLTYFWTPATGLNSYQISNPIALIYGTKTYSVSVSTNNGCLASDSVRLNSTPMNAIEICMAGVDAGNKNLIVWNKPLSTAIDSFFIHKETNSTGVYQIAGALRYNSFSTFSDANSFPAVQSNKYMISLKDKCGLQSAFSKAHKTMHLTINKGMGLSWNLIWGAYEGFTVSTYNVFRGKYPDSLHLIGTSSGSNTQYTDLTPDTGYLYYQVEVVSPNNCDPSKSYNSSRSNIASTQTSSLSEIRNLQKLITIYPNPASSFISVYLAENYQDETLLNIYTITGTLVRTEKLYKSQQEINIDFLSAGIYFIEIKSRGFTGKQKILIYK